MYAHKVFVFHCHCRKAEIRFRIIKMCFATVHQESRTHVLYANHQYFLNILPHYQSDRGWLHLHCLHVAPLHGHFFLIQSKLAIILRVKNLQPPTSPLPFHLSVCHCKTIFVCPTSNQLYYVQLVIKHNTILYPCIIQCCNL